MAVINPPKPLNCVVDLVVDNNNNGSYSPTVTTFYNTAQDYNAENAAGNGTLQRSLIYKRALKLNKKQHAPERGL